MKLTTLSINDLQKLLAIKEISAYEIAQHTLLSIEKYNPSINAWTEITHQRMLNEAKIIDRQIQIGDKLPPLAAIPYAVKNLFDVIGYTTLVGSHLFSDRPEACKDAWVVNKLNKSGALLTGMLNMDAYAYGFTNENSYYGATCNPCDLSRITGGSSGGSAAAVASGLVHFSLGTDTNGSIRVPASLCGIFGLKPTFGRLSRSGTHPFVSSLDHIGIFARSVEDLTLVYDRLQGTDVNDPFQIAKNPSFISNLLKIKLKAIRSTILGGFFSTWCTNETYSAVSTASKVLDIKEETILDDAELARTAAFIITAAESGNQYLPALQNTPSTRFEPHARERLLAGAMIPSTWYIQAQRFRRYFHQRALSLFKNFDLLIAPATPCCAPFIGQKNIHINGQDLSIRINMGMLTQPISLIGLPVCTVPILTNSGLPIGLQLIGAPFREDVVLRAAYILEKSNLTFHKVY
ncbi:AtzE family amidohydrolase [Pantoea sp. Aalb]|uniref:AtzE family amidohydrolase n=1 Tax=Pantoea sp. Aalb TaxID=2576762 RepID=UPI00132415F0|nr:AtzE family amidohydrolase [Pantoea sp. Aalb]MXP67603.1 AtzE family amidohydrolase [Pantoea sp. Aalb]